MPRRGCLLLSLVLVAASFIVFSTPATGLHWCSPLAVSVSPQSGGTGEVATISVGLTNGISETLTIQSISLVFSWTFTVYNFGSMTLPGGASATRIGSVQLPSSAGDYQVTVNVFGKTPSDLIDETCSASGTFRVTTSLIPYLAVGGVVIVAVVVLAILFARRKRVVPATPLGSQMSQSSVPACPVCGLPLGWIAPQNRWYCSRCGEYR